MVFNLLQRITKKIVRGLVQTYFNNYTRERHLENLLQIVFNGERKETSCNKSKNCISYPK